jgi:hypothetical protein
MLPDQPKTAAASVAATSEPKLIEYAFPNKQLAPVVF